MKNTKVPLYKWMENEISPSNYLDIDWPKVQKEIGVDQLDWLLKQPVQKCQLMLEITDSNTKTLVAEFYDSLTEKNYYMMWS